MIRNTVEYFKFYLLSDADDDISTDTTQAALELDETDPDDYTWLPCTFIATSVVNVVENGQSVQKNRTDWRTTSAITWNAANYPETSYGAYAKVTDNPEAPIVSLGPVPISNR